MRVRFASTKVTMVCIAAHGQCRSGAVSEYSGPRGGQRNKRNPLLRWPVSKPDALGDRESATNRIGFIDQPFGVAHNFGGAFYRGDHGALAAQHRLAQQLTFKAALA